jgi:predicted ATPase
MREREQSSTITDFDRQISLGDETLQQGLKQLLAVELVYQRGLVPQATYLFKHALIQDTAYQSLLKSTRQQYHQQIARVLEDRFRETTETPPGLLAHHYTEAGLIARRFLIGSGQVEEGLTVLAEALAAVNSSEERTYEAELWRIKGELLLTQEGYRLQAEGLREKTEEAEGCFLRAIAIAQKQHAKSLELRAVMSLARLWQSQGKTAEARTMLSEVYNWFTEGFDTKDLQEAKALLDELS